MKTFLSLFTVRGLVAIAFAIVAIAVGTYVAMLPAAPAEKTAVAAKPPVPVVVKTLAEQNVRLWSEFSGRLHAVDYAEIRPEVSGRITQVRFEDGQTVKAGDILFVIDPRPFEAAVARAEGNVTGAKSRVALAKIDKERYDALIQAHAIAQSELDKVDNTQRVATSVLESSEAELKQARIDLEHAYVTAPISGRVSRAEITLGNLVQSGAGAPLLTSIVSQDGIYADFEVDEQTYLQTVRNTAVGNAQEQKIPVQLIIQGDKDHAYAGFIQNFDNRIDTASGTIRARAKFENEDGTLVPGMFATVRLAGSKERSLLLVPDRAVSFDQSKKYVYVVDQNNKVTYREVELGKQVLAQRVVLSGLQAGDRIIVDGTQQVRPNDLVSATEVAPEKSVTMSGGVEQVAKSGSAQ